MRIIKPINQHFPVWSFLCGDHALAEEVKKINPSLLAKPDFLDPLENNLRLEVFRSRRNWIWQDMGDNCSFALAQISIEDLEEYDSCFEQVSFAQLPEEYRNSLFERRDFKIERECKTDITKTYVSSKIEHELMKKMCKSYKKVTEKMVLDQTIDSRKNLSVALNRTSIMEKQDGTIVVMDGLHRLSAYYWAKAINKNKNLPNKLFCYYWKANYKC